VNALDETAETPHRSRMATRAFRPGRVLPATVTAAVLTVVAALVAMEVIAALVGRPVNVLPVAALARLGRQTRWDAPLALAVAAVASAVGLLLLLLALRPGRPRTIALTWHDPDTVLGITPHGLRRQTAQAAESVDGITRARTRVRHRHVRVRATSPLLDVRDLDDQVRHAVEERLAGLAPLRPLRLRVSVRRREGGAG
jgi:hypothetical protein